MLKQHVLVELNQFIQAITSHRGIAKNITAPTLLRTSLHLLEDLPASRDIVLDYFSLVFDVCVNSYVTYANKDPQGLGYANATQHEDDSFLDIQEALENLICKGPPAWGPVIASWSLDLIGRLSDKYSNKRKMSIGGSCNFWLNCSSMRCLLSLVSSCFRKLNDSEAESCVEALLAAFQKYSMTFDWVVARLGGCFPQKIISQILQCGLKRFSDDFRCRFDSEVGILDDLAFAHEKELTQAIREMLDDGFHPKKAIHAVIIPFIMQICNFSDLLLDNTVGVFLEVYDETLLQTIIRHSPIWLANKVFLEMQPSLNNVALKLKNHGAKVLITISKLADKYAWCQDFLEYTLQELEQVILMTRTCPLLMDLATEEAKYLLWKSCISSNFFEQQTAVRLLLIVSTQHSHIYYQTISELLRVSYVDNKNGIGAVIRIIGGQAGIVEFPNIKRGLQMVLEEALLKEELPPNKRSHLDSCEALIIFQNLNTLAKLENKNILQHLKQQTIPALNKCLPKILQILNCVLIKLMLAIEDTFENNNNDVDMKDEIEELFKKWKANAEGIKVDTVPQKEHCSALAHCIIDLLDTIDAGSKTSVMKTPEVLKLAALTVKYFFASLTEKNLTLRAASVNRAFHLLQRQCSARRAARTISLRKLIEGALFFHGYLFGQPIEQDFDETEIPENEMLIKQIEQHNYSANAGRTILHAGVIGRGLREEKNFQPNSPDPELQRLLLKAIDSCCVDLDKPNSVEGYSMVSLLLVEMVSTDVMYNGLPFPDEEFTKVTMERDLLIRKAFFSAPILWALLGFIATHRPALCFSSVLLRALCATCLHQWKAKNVNKLDPVDPNEELTQTTKKLLQILAMGQLLPPPLSYLHIIIEHFDAPEIAILLKECVWNYLKDHVPSPALFQIDSNGLHWRNPSLSKIPPIYVDALRIFMQKKLPKLGPYYHQMFIMPEINGTSPSAPADVPSSE